MFRVPATLSLQMRDCSIELAGRRLATPVIAAAGTCGYVDELADAFDPRSIGAITTKSITREPRDGNEPWRILDHKAGMINAIGLANVGLDAFLADKLPRAATLSTTLIGSIAGHALEDYLAVAEAFDAREELPIVELNVSCPNTDTGRQFGDDPDALGELVREVRGVLRRTKLFVKLSPGSGDCVPTARAAVEAGCDGLTLCNTLPVMSIDVETKCSRLTRPQMGLSGPAIHPLVVRLVHETWVHVARDANVPIIGLGGVLAWDDAAELILAGASAVGIGTGLFVDPRAPLAIHRGLARWVERLGCGSIAELVGAFEGPPPSARN